VHYKSRSDKTIGKKNAPKMQRETRETACKKKVQAVLKSRQTGEGPSNEREAREIERGSLDKTGGGVQP